MYFCDIQKFEIQSLTSGTSEHCELVDIYSFISWLMYRPYTKPCSICPRTIHIVIEPPPPHHAPHFVPTSIITSLWRWGCGKDAESPRLLVVWLVDITTTTNIKPWKPLSSTHPSPCASRTLRCAAPPAMLHIVEFHLLISAVLPVSRALTSVVHEDARRLLQRQLQGAAPLRDDHARARGVLRCCVPALWGEGTVSTVQCGRVQ